MSFAIRNTGPFPHQTHTPPRRRAEAF